MKIDIHKDYSKLRGSTELHNELKNSFRIAVGRKFKDVAVIPYDVAFVRAYSQPEKCFMMGMEGVPDLIVFGNNYYLFFDAKTGKNKFQNNQIHFASRMKSVNKGVQKVFKLNIIKEALDIIESYENDR